MIPRAPIRIRLAPRLPTPFCGLCLLVVLCLVESLSASSFRLATYNIEQGVGAPGTDSFDKAVAVIARVDPDVVALVEARGASDQTNFFKMAETLGYPHAVLSPVSVLDTGLRTGVFSRYPVVFTGTIRSPEGAEEMTRQNLAVKIDVPGTPNDPYVIIVHYKCCWDGPKDGFRRAVEARRTREFIQGNTIPALDNIFLVGDFNLVGTDGTVYSSPPSELPSKYVLGGDVEFPLTYSTNVDSYFSDLGVEKLVATQVNGQTKTWSTRSNSNSVLDYILASAPLRNRPHQTEIYNSAIDQSGVGLPKSGPVPATNASSLASDHFLLFGDFDLGPPPPAPVLEWPTAAPITAGERLADSILSGGVAVVPGQFSFADPDFEPAEGGDFHEVVFTPDDAENFGPATALVSVEVVPAGGDAGMTFAQWSGGAGSADELLLQYAIGGAAGPSDGPWVAPEVTRSNGALSITAVVRTNDPALVVTGEVRDRFDGGQWSAGGVANSASEDQAGVPEGCERRMFSAGTGTNTMLFLRLRATLAP